MLPLMGLDIDFAGLRVVVLYDADADAHQLGSSAANQAVVPWVKMHDPLQPIALAVDGSSTELSNMLVECHNLVHFNWGRDDGSQAQLLTRLKDIRASLILKTLHEGRGRGRCKLGGRQFTPVTMLNTVLLCDSLRDLSDLKSAIDQSLRIVLDQVLAESLRAQLQAWKCLPNRRCTDTAYGWTYAQWCSAGALSSASPLCGHATYGPIVARSSARIIWLWRPTR